MDDLREVIARVFDEMQGTAPHGFHGGPDSWSPYADAALAAIKQAGFVVVSRDDLERVVGLLRATDALQENGFADDAVNIVHAMIEASNG